MKILILAFTGIIAVFSGCTTHTKVESWRFIIEPTNRIYAPAINETRLISDFDDITNKKLGIFTKYPDSSTLLQKNPNKSLKTEPAKTYNSFSPPKFLALGLLKFYQTVLTQGIKSSCPFCITCSSYSVKAIKQFGIILGYILTIDRLLRCNRLAGNKYFIFAPQQTFEKTSRRRICLIDEPANNNIFNRKVHNK